jgi:hypothetical protein
MNCLPRAILVFLLALLASLGLWTDITSPVDTCMVTSDQPDVEVRVGPGENRAVRQYLPPGEAFPVTGQATAEDGSAWWQLQLAGIDQAWVNQADVSAAGACNLVQAVDAPPVVQPPPDDSGQTPPATDEPTDEPSEPGTWGDCGSCDSCGHPSDECILSPDGQCVWDPAQCAPTSSGGDSTDSGSGNQDDEGGGDIDE